MDCRGSRKLETLSHKPLSATHAGSQQWEKGTAVGGNRSGDRIAKNGSSYSTVSENKTNLTNLV